MVKIWGDKDRILNGFKSIAKWEEADMFCHPVDVENYHIVVAFPTDLSTIMKRFRNNYYR